MGEGRRQVNAVMGFRFDIRVLYVGGHDHIAARFNARFKRDQFKVKYLFVRFMNGWQTAVGIRIGIPMSREVL